MAPIGIGARQPGQGVVPVGAEESPTSSNRPADGWAGDGAAGAAGAGVGAGCCGIGAVIAEAMLLAAPCAGIDSGRLHLGHLTVRPASSSLAAKLCPQAQVTLIGIVFLF
ncbi:MAG TPA: hypothetical protein VFB96_15355 [Pirellulaceae bacterium]|nr:hypothetical protein [Pirellulaceae bacterium]